MTASAEPVGPVGAVVPPQARRRRGAVLAVGAVLGLLVTGALIMQRTQAAFTGATGNPGSAWSSGTLALSDDDSNTALFTVSGLLPGDTGSRCIRVTYTGTPAVTVKLYASGASGSLAPWVNLSIDEASVGGNNGSFGSCTGFSGSTVYSGNVSAFASTVTGFASGVGAFAPTGANQSRVYRFTYTVDPATPNDQQAQSAAITFVWESR